MSVEARPTHEESWQRELAAAGLTPEQLLQQLDLPLSLLAGARAANRLFPLRVPRPYLARIRPGDPADPLLLQVLPQLLEAEVTPGFVDDPLEEASAARGHGLIRKYRSRALLVLTGACAINCRYCFRRHFPYQETRLRPDDWQGMVQELAADPDINEVILSGGDPLAINDRMLKRLVGELERIPHLLRLRIHTRLPIVIPQRVNEPLLDWLRQTRLQTVVVLHANHPNEVDLSVGQAIERLRRTGATVLNQSVLLARVNDDAEALARLSERLFAHGALPYYLHALDPVAGAAHFAVDDDRARLIARQLLERLPGFLVPRLVREVPGKDSKWPLDLGLI